MARVIGIGGIFFRSRDPFALRAWYQRHLGFPTGESDHPSVSFALADGEPEGSDGYAIWAPFKADT